MLYRAKLRDLTVRLLKDAKTLAGTRVYSPMDQQTWDGDFPAITVRAPVERKQSAGRVLAEFTTVATIVVTAQVAAVTDDGAEAALDVFADQIECAVIGSSELARCIQQFVSVDSQIAISGDGKEHMGQLTVAFAMEFTELPEDFITVDAVPLEGVDIDVDLRKPTDPTGIYANPPYPDGVASLTRSEGRDGRLEAVLNIDLPLQDDQCS